MNSLIEYQVFLIEMQFSAQISCQIFGSPKVFLALIVFSFQVGIFAPLSTLGCSTDIMIVLTINMLQTDSPNFYSHINSPPTFASEVNSKVSYILSYILTQIDLFSILNNPVFE